MYNIFYWTRGCKVYFKILLSNFTVLCTYSKNIFLIGLLHTIKSNFHSGLGGNPVILEIGGPAYLLPLVDRKKVYDLRTVPQLVGDEKCFIIGAGAGPWPYTGVNCEVISGL